MGNASDMTGGKSTWYLNATIALTATAYDFITTVRHEYKRAPGFA